jgi:hypothetical protein
MLSNNILYGSAIEDVLHQVHALAGPNAHGVDPLRLREVHRPRSARVKRDLSEHVSRSARNPVLDGHATDGRVVVSKEGANTVVGVDVRAAFLRVDRVHNRETLGVDPPLVHCDRA